MDFKNIVFQAQSWNLVVGHGKSWQIIVKSGTFMAAHVKIRIK